MAINFESPPAGMYSTNLNSRIKDVDTLTERIAMTLGYPQINIEAHTIQVHDNIAQACEFFTKFAGYTDEYLIFHSSLYEPNKGLYMPKLFNNTPELSGLVTNDDVTFDTSPKVTIEVNSTNQDRVIYSFTANRSETKPVEFLLQYRSGYYHHAEKLLVTAIYNDITDEIDASVAQYGSTYTTETPKVRFKVATSGEEVEIICNADIKGIATINISDFEPTPKKQLKSYSRSMDDLLLAPRKVIDLYAFEEGSTSGINTLFTIEQTLAQQTYFSYAMGKYGFDLISWYTMKEWMETRQKLLQTKYQWRFNDRDQRMYLTPQPGITGPRRRAEFWGAVGAYVEKPLKDVLPELWVYQYALALTKITIARIRGKYQGTNLFGGGTPNYSELLTEGNAEKEKLETQMMEGTPGFGDAAPPMFFVG